MKGKSTLPPKVPLNDMSWQGIQTVAKSGRVRDYWKEGDTKTIILNGKVGNKMFQRFPIDVFILGFDHNPLMEGYLTIHFGIGMKDGRILGLCDNDYTHSSETIGFRMCKDAKNPVPWRDSFMRTNILGADGDPADPAKNTLLAALPRALREVMLPTEKYTDTEFCKGHASAATHRTKDVLWLPSVREVFGDGIGGRVHLQEQYDYFKHGGSTKVYRHSTGDKPVRAWCRTTIKSGLNQYFYNINTNGQLAKSNPCVSLALVPCFAV